MNDPAVVRARAQARRSLWDYYDAVVARTPAPLTPVLLEEWERQAAQLRALIHSALGVTPHRPVEVEVEWLGATEFETYRIERLAYRTREEFVVPANLYVPTNVTGRLPAIIAPHGHAQNGKAHANYQALYIGLVRKGFIVLAPDCIGHGERRALGHRRLGSPFLIGTSLMGMELWDIMKGIDLLVARDDVDPRRIGCVGNSGGGTQTIWAAALDERIAAAVASDATTSFAYNHSKERDICFCNLAPQLVPHAEIWHVLGLVAPRPLRLVGGAMDPMFPRDLQREVLRRTKRVYDLYGAADRVDQVITNEPHSLTGAKREAIYEFFCRHLQGVCAEEAAQEPADIEPLPADHPAILCFPAPPREFALSLDEVVRKEADPILKAREVPHDPAGWAAYRARQVERLRTLLLRGEAAAPRRVVRAKADRPSERLPGDLSAEFVALWVDPWTPLAAYLLPAGGPLSRIRMIVDDEGKSSKWSEQQMLRAVQEGCCALALDVRGWGELKPEEIPPDDEWVQVQKALGYDVPLLGLRASDVLAVVEWLAAQAQGSTIEIVGRRYGGVVSLVAAILDERVRSVQLDELPFSLIPSAETDRLVSAFTFVPGLLRDVGDVPHLIGLLAPRACRIVCFAETPADPSYVRRRLEPALQSYEAAGASRRLVFDEALGAAAYRTKRRSAASTDEP